MRRSFKWVVSLVIGAVQHGPMLAAGEFETTPGVAAIETGETWSNGKQRYRLFGVQSCLRGTFYTDLTGQKRDCGEASIVVLAAFLTDLKPHCVPIARSENLTFVVCSAMVAGQKIDLGTALITKGYAFAALDREGMPLTPAYAVAEAQARTRRAGLWQFDDLEHPSVFLSRMARERQGGR